MTCTSCQSCFIFCGYSCAKESKCPHPHWALMPAERRISKWWNTRHTLQRATEHGRRVSKLSENGVATLNSGQGNSCWEDDMWVAWWKWGSWAEGNQWRRVWWKWEKDTQKWGDEVRQMGEASRGEINHGGLGESPAGILSFHWKRHKMSILRFEQVRGMTHSAFRKLIRWLSWEEDERKTRKSRDTREATEIKQARGD